MKKSISLLLLCVLVIGLFVGCSAPSLSDKFDKDKINEAAKRAIELFTNGDYQKLNDELTREDLKQYFTDEAMNKAKAEIMPNAGKFIEYTSESIVGQKDKSGTEFALAVIIAKYENQKVTYTMQFDENVKMIGFYIK